MSVAAPLLRKTARASSLALLVPALGLRRGLEYRRLALGTAAARNEAVYEHIWQDAAESLGVELTSEGGGAFTIHGPGRTVTVRTLTTPLDGQDVIAASLDKPLVSARLSALGIPVPASLEFRPHELRRAFRFLAASPGQCVVKPAAGSAGSGVTCGVETRSDLLRAILSAAAFGDRLVIEHQVEGDGYRLLFLDGILLDTVRRSPARVVGDGSSTFLELIAAENRRRVVARGFAGLTLIRPDLDCILTLRRAGFRLNDVPPDGLWVAVKTTNGDGGDRDTETVGPPAAALVAEAAAACAAVGARLAGVDLATPDPSRGLGAGGGTVIEVNVPPGLHYHYLVADPGRATHVAVPILRTLVEYD